jgi:hypothetical protein
MPAPEGVTCSQGSGHPLCLACTAVENETVGNPALHPEERHIA